MNHSLTRLMCALGAASCALMYVAPAEAADAGIGAAAAPAPDAVVGIEEIVVTAQRREENLQRAALAVSAVDAAALRNAGVSQPQDLTKLIPALQLAPIGGGGTQVTIRGVGNFAPFLYSEPAVAINYDGIYLARSAAPNGLFFDLERIEVLKGPQGTLYGRNATGGAVNIITAKPDLTGFHTSEELEVGNYGLLRASAMVNLPLSSTVALRIAAQSVDRNGYLTDGYLDDKDRAVRAQLLFVPTDALKINVETDYIHQGGKGPGAVFVTPRGYLYPSNPWTGATSPASQGLLRNASLGITGGADPNFLPPFGTDGSTDLDIWGLAASIDYDLGFATLTFQPSYRRTENDFKHYAGGFPLVSTEKSNQKTAEARLTSSSPSALKWVVGAYYFQDSSSLYAFANQGIADTITLAPSLPTQSVALFGQTTYSVTDAIRITGGLRYTEEHKTQTGTNISGLPPVPAGFPAPAPVFFGIACPAPAAFDIPANTCTAGFDGRVQFNKVTWKTGLEFDLAPQSLLYVNAETGFKAGGFYPSLAPNVYKPEKLFAVTLGSKNRFLDNTLQLNTETFYWKYKDKQVSHLGPLNPAGYAIITQNAGQATIYGAEVDLIWQFTHSDRFNLDLQYLHSKYDSFQYDVPLLSAAATGAAVDCPQQVSVDPNSGARTSRVDCSGRPLPQSPQYTLNISYEHSFALPNEARLQSIVGSRLESSFYVGEEFLAGEHQGSSHVSYASLTYRARDDRFSIGGFVDNIENQAVKASSFVQPAIGLPLVVLRPPRTYGARLTYQF